MQTRQLTVNGLQLALAEAGAGAKPLLLVHGFTGAKEDFTDWLDPLARLGWHAVAYDQRGHGESGHPAGEDAYSLPILSGDLLGLCDALGWRQFALLGHSMGGMVAQQVAVDAPDRLTALMLMDTSHGCPEGIEPETVALGAEVVRADGMAGLVEAQRAMGPGPLDSSAHLRLVAERPGYGEWCEQKTLLSSPHMWLAISHEIVEQPDRLEDLRSLEVPALVMVGEEDRAFLAQSEAMAKAITGARLVVVPRAGHSPQFESTDEWWRALTAFLEEVPA